MLQKSEEDWKKELSPEQYEILRKKGTERAGTGKYLHNKETGVYTCAACDYPVFKSTTKYESHSGWPSFTAPYSEDSVQVISCGILDNRKIRIPHFHWPYNNFSAQSLAFIQAKIKLFNNYIV